LKYQRNLPTFLPEQPFGYHFPTCYEQTLFSKKSCMTLSPASPADQDGLYALHVELFRHHIEQIWGWDDDWQLDNFKEEWAEVRTEILSQDGELLGYIQTRQESDHFYVLNLAVYPGSQCLGLGSMAMEVLKQRAIFEGLSIKLSVFRTNQRVIEFYKRLGFEIEAETETGLRMHWHDEASTKDKNGEQAAS
jgi:ribosomal protein S18 acetylase RimI-like enzyme